MITDARYGRKAPELAEIPTLWPEKLKIFSKFVENHQSYKTDRDPKAKQSKAKSVFSAIQKTPKKAKQSKVVFKNPQISVKSKAKQSCEKQDGSPDAVNAVNNC